jgi:hypothetical protein
MACASLGEFSSATGPRHRVTLAAAAAYHHDDGFRSRDKRAQHRDSARAAVAQIQRALAARCRGLADEELLWEPVEDSWNLVPDAAHPGGWTYPYDFDPPHPHPVTSIGWRFVHLIGNNEIYMEHAFGPGLRNFPRPSGSRDGGRGLGGLEEQSPTRDGLVDVGERQ